ncbi:hypothetical protein MKW92_037517 [Papaver armeniacum]|nr:hypothetical protein MKW92_037517 [Papaver armeniacum]
MAETRSLIVVCVFICALVASNTLMCTAKVDFYCSLVDDELIRDNKAGIETTKQRAVAVGLCFTPEACHALCSGQTNTRGVTSQGKSGNCGADDEAGGDSACACCQVSDL